MALVAHDQNVKGAIDLMLAGAWHTAMFERQQKLKPLSEILDRTLECPQTDDELWIAMERWAAFHNAQLERSGTNG